MNNVEWFRNAVAAQLAPPPRTSTSEWAKKNLHLSREEGPDPGIYRCDDVPWQTVIMDALDDVEADTLVIMAASQTGKTTISKAITGRYVDIEPCPILNVQSTELMAKDYSNRRLATMFRDCPIFKNKLTRDDVYEKGFAGGYVAMAWAQSAATLASRSIRILNCDEIDRWPSSAGGEGDPLDISEARTENYPNRKHIYVSSPTTDSGRINKKFLGTDQNYFYVKCPHCGHEHHINFIVQLRMVNDNPDTAMLACVECGGLYGDRELPNMVKQGRFVAKYPERKARGFHVSRLMMPHKTKITRMAMQYLAAKPYPEQLQVFMNTRLGLVYKDLQGQISNATTLAARRENYDYKSLPADMLVLTAGVDTQDDRLEYEILGWGLDEETWGVQYGVLMGNPSEQDVWLRLDDVLKREFYTQDNRLLRIGAASIDSGGHHVQKVYDFCAKRSKRYIWAIKGAGGAKPMWPSRAGKSRKYKGQLVRTIGVDTIKDTLFARLRTEQAGVGYCHFPHTYDDGYFEQLTAERRVAEYDKKGALNYSWQKEKHARNEALDCRVYAWAAMQGLIYERGLDIRKLAQARQYTMFQGDPYTSAHRINDTIEAAPVAHNPAPVTPAKTPPPARGRRRASGRRLR
jgi:phage terminase large subunit GpA-like protein